MADNYNINENQGDEEFARGLVPGQPGMNMGNVLFNNAQAQDQQEQLVQQAIERTKQAKMQTGLQQRGGLEAEHGLVPKAQALTDLRAAAETSQLDDNKKQEILDDAEQNWPDVVSQDAIHRLTNALRPTRPVKMAEGRAFQADGTEKDSNDKPFPKGTWIQESVDDSGNSVFVHSAQDAASAGASGKSEASNEKLWRELDTKLSGMIKTRFGATGMLATKIIRADSAINTLTSTPVLTKQDLENVSTDIAAIYQGGVPGSMQIVENSYGTTLTNLMETIRHYTGHLNSMFGLNEKVLVDTKHKLLQVLNDMRNSALSALQSIFESEVPAYKPLIQSDPARWKELLDEKMHGLTSGLLSPKGDVMEPGPAPTRAPNPANATPGAAPVNEKDPLGIL